MSEDGVIMEAPALRDFAADLLQAGGFTAEEARITAQSLVLSNLLGHDSHGVIRVAEYLHDLKHGALVSAVGLNVIRETDNSCLAEGGFGLGQVQMPRFLERLLAKADNTATVSGAMRNCGHAGRLGEWAEKIGQAGFAGLVMVNDNGVLHVVAPPGGKAGRTSTNPMAFAIPLPGGEPFVLDMATSAAAIGKIRLAHISGKPCPPDLLQDSEGRPTADPSALFKDPKGALLPMGGAQGYKGFGLAMIIDLLAAGLSGGFAPPAPDGTQLANNIFVTVWNPHYFAGIEHMQEQAEKYCDFIRQTPPKDPESPVRVAGDRAKTEREKREATGIPLSRGTCQTLAKSAELTGIAVSDAFADLLKR